jgi:hypothetical protein
LIVATRGNRQLPLEEMHARVEALVARVTRT